jgi:7-cyano-7-deazaguanine synthase
MNKSFETDPQTDVLNRRKTVRPGTPAVVLLSGGLDSATILAIALAQGYDAYCMTFRYGQRHDCELLAARKVAEKMGAKDFLEVDIDMRRIGGSALTADIDVPKDEMPGQGSIPVTYVPARNTIFLSFGLAWAETLGARDIFIGANAVDYSGYPDCRPEYIDAYQHMANLATAIGVTQGGISIHAPLMKWTKARIIQEGTALGVNYGITHSCYDPDPEGRSCGRCDSCILRHRGFMEAGITDPTTYVAGTLFHDSPAYPSSRGPSSYSVTETIDAGALKPEAQLSAPFASSTLTTSATSSSVTLADVQSGGDVRGVELQRVGVRGLRYPITVMDRLNGTQDTVADIDMSVNLPESVRGTHMSRFVDILEEYRERIGMHTLRDMLADMCSILDSSESEVNVHFPYFLNKKAPVSGRESLMAYDCGFSGFMKDGCEFFEVSVRVPVTIVCPCSKEISSAGAHNQRAVLAVRVRYSGFVWIEELIELAEQCGSCDVHTLLKREDEKHVTEKAHDNPRFVEDVTREMALRLRSDSRITWFAVRVESQESIHNHDAFAVCQEGG